MTCSFILYFPESYQDVEAFRKAFRYSLDVICKRPPAEGKRKQH